MCPVLDTLAVDLPLDQLPTIGDVLACTVFIREKKMTEACTRKTPPLKKVIQEVLAKTEAIWQAAELPVVTTRRAEQLLKDRLDTMITLQNYPIKKRGDGYDRRRKDFVAAARLLFDISLCKCAADGCACDDATKLQVDARRPFLQDQRIERRLKIGEVAVPAPSLRLRTSSASSPGSSASGPASSASASPSPMKRRRLRSERADQDFVAPKPRASRSADSNRNTTPLPNTAATAARFNMPSKAAIVSAYAVDNGLVTPTDKRKVVDRGLLQDAAPADQGNEECQRHRSAGLRQAHGPLLRWPQGQHDGTAGYPRRVQDPPHHGEAKPCRGAGQTRLPLHRPPSLRDHKFFPNTPPDTTVLLPDLTSHAEAGLAALKGGGAELASAGFGLQQGP
ncbi:hypothetical protein FOCC_FOCC015550, partial [Frankliniella occidentalis]